MNRVGTEIYRSGFYTKKDINVIFIVVTKKDVPTPRQLVQRVDPGAFIIISNVQRISGRGISEEEIEILFNCDLISPRNVLFQYFLSCKASIKG